MRLANKVAAITGAAQGIGRGMARMFAREGAAVVIGDIQDDKGAAVAAEISAAGGRAAFIHTDVAVASDLERMVQTAVEQFGGLDILVNDAIWSKGGTAVTLEEADWDRAIAVGLKACYLGAKYAVPAMARRGGGSIINISSVHGLLAARNSLVYESLKGGLILMTKEMASDFGPQGIRVNAICPGMIVHEGHRNHDPTSAHARFAAELYPVRRYGNPDDIAYGAVYLAADESSFVSGHALVIDGGLTAQLQDDLAGRIAQYVREHPDQA